MTQGTDGDRAVLNAIISGVLSVLLFPLLACGAYWLGHYIRAVDLQQERIEKLERRVDELKRGRTGE